MADILTRHAFRLPKFSSRALRVTISGCLYCLLSLLSFPLAFPALGAELESFILNNVLLIDTAGKDNSLSVNIRIVEGKLDLITQQVLDIQHQERAYDARGGFVLGSLKLGELAGFMILAGDPREDVALLLDTKQHARFAIYKGSILKNEYSAQQGTVAVAESEPQERWLAYTPPPLAVPLDYADRQRWNHFEGKYLSGLVTGAVVLDRQRWLNQNNNSEFQVGDLDKDYDGGEIRAFRFGAVGTINLDQPWVWTIAGATHAFDKGFDQRNTDDFTIYDLRLDIPLGATGTVSIGKQKEPISMDRLAAMTNLPMQERAAVLDALLPARNVGILVSGTLLDQEVTLAGGVFNNWLDRDQPDSMDNNATQLVGRTTWVPWESENELTLLHLGAGYRFSSGGEQGLLAMGPEFNNAPEFSQTTVFEPQSLDTYSLEASLRSGPFWLHSEYARMDIDDRSLGNPDLDGYHLTASWIVTGENRGYNHRTGIFDGIKIARSVDQNGWGAVELSARFSHTDLSAVNDAFSEDAGKMDIWSLGANWWLSPYLNMNMNYRFITLDRLGVDGESHGINARIMIVLE